MGAADAVHPTDQTLHSYGLGKLDDRYRGRRTSIWSRAGVVSVRVAEIVVGQLPWTAREDARAQTGQIGQGVGPSVGIAHRRASPPPPCRRAETDAARAWPSIPTTRSSASSDEAGMGMVYLAKNRLMGRGTKC